MAFLSSVWVNQKYFKNFKALENIADSGWLLLQSWSPLALGQLGWCWHWWWWLWCCWRWQESRTVWFLDGGVGGPVWPVHTHDIGDEDEDDGDNDDNDDDAESGLVLVVLVDQKVDWIHPQHQTDQPPHSSLQWWWWWWWWLWWVFTFQKPVSRKNSARGVPHP